MTENSERLPRIDADFLLLHLEYSIWATRKVISVVDRVGDELLNRLNAGRSPSILGTLQHIYRADEYYLKCMKGEVVHPGADVPPTYVALKAAWPTLHFNLLHWADENLAARKDEIVRGWALCPTWMILMHLVSHTVHHLGQVLTLAEQAGVVLIESDKIDLLLYYLDRYQYDAFGTV